MVKNFGNKINTAGFDKNPENINREGRPASIRTDLKNMLGSDGEITIKAENVTSINEDGSVTVKLAQTESIVLRLLDWVNSDKGSESLKAIQMIMETIDGKPNQKTELALNLEPITGMVITDSGE